MIPCEDYPYCGHGTDKWGNPDCPDSKGRFTCVRCGKRLPKNSSTSFCSKCERQMELSHYDDPYGDNDFGEHDQGERF